VINLLLSHYISDVLHSQRTFELAEDILEVLP